MATGIYANPVDTTNVFGRIDQYASDRDQFSVRYALYDVGSQNSRGAGGLNAPSASTGLASTDQTVSVSNTLVLSTRTVLETRAQFTHSDLAAPPTDLIGPSVAIAGVATFGTSSSSPTGRLNKLYQVVNNLSHQAGAHALRAGVDFLYNDDLVTYPRSARGNYSFSSLANFLGGVYNNAGFTQTFGVTQAAQTNPNLGFHVQDEWRLTSALTFNFGVRYDLQFLETISTDTDNLSPRAGFAWVPFDSQRTIVRGSAGLFYDRVPLRAVANALLSARQHHRPRPAAADRGQPVAGPGRRPGLPGDPRRRRSVGDAGQPDDDGPRPAERLLAPGERRSRAAARRPHDVQRRLSVPARPQPADVDQPERAVVRRDRHQQRLPSEFRLRQQQPVLGGRRLELSRPALLAGGSGRRGGGTIASSYTLSKSMNNLGEFFFSSPIDPLDVSKDWGRSDDDQRHRLVLSGSVQSPMAPAATLWEYLTHGFQVGGMVQAYSAPPFNILSGVTTVQGTPGRPIVDGEFIDRNAGEGTRYVNVTARVSRTFRLGPRVQLEALVEAFNLTNHVNVVTRNTTFGPGAYPDNPLPAFGQVTAVGEPRSLQFGFRVRY